MAAQHARPGEVWILDDGLIMGGGQRFALRLADVMRNEGLRVGFATDPDSRFADAVRASDYEIFPVRYPRLVPPAVWAMPKAISRLHQLLSRIPGDALVIGNTARCQAYASAALLTTSHWPVLVHLLHEQTSVTRPTARAVYRRLGALVAVGDQTADLYRQNLPGVAVDAISNFFDEDQVERTIGARTPPPDGARPVIGFLGRLIPNKGVLELVEELGQVPGAWAALRVAAPPQDAAYVERIRRRIDELGLADRVQLLGEISDLDAFFASIDVLAVPSVGHHEGQPTVILESLLYARPVIARSQLHEPLLDGLPVSFYATPAELAQRLAQPAPTPLDAETFLRRFGARDVVRTLLAQAARHRDPQERPPELARPIGGRRPDGHDWTRHLMRHRTVTRRGSPVPTIDSYPVFAAGLPRTFLGSQRTFRFDGADYRYLYHRYNNTWMNERAVEVPIARRAIEEHAGESVLEIGNVLSHYDAPPHEIVDKYERGPDVRNIDVLDLEPERRWDLIVSVSTLEHVGVDDAPLDPDRGAEAAELLASRLAPGGELLLTVPVGYNPDLDRTLAGGAIDGMDLRALRRVQAGPHWEEVAPYAVLGQSYDWRNSTARAVLIGRLRSPSCPPPSS
jgi:glycosyltransferase involved in cell wall biosynthesis